MRRKNLASGLAWGSLAILLIGLAACTPVKSTPKAASKEQLLWPLPPDQPRFQFEATLRSAADIEEETAEMALKRQMVRGSSINDEPVIYKPSAILSRGGLVYVADPAAKAITVFDAPRRKLFRFGLREPNLLHRPQAMAMDTAGNIYVLDSAQRKVMVFDAIGLFLSAIDLDKRFQNPVGLAVQGDGKTIYVVDRGEVDGNEHKVIALAPDGTERFRLGPRGIEPGQFNIPLAATVGRDGSLYVVDSGNFRVQVFDAAGRFKFQFGGMGAELGRFSRPRAIALDMEGNIYVADAGFNNVQIFDADGRLLMPLGRLGREPAPGNYSLIAGVAVDETGRLYIVDHYFKKIEVFRRLNDDEGRQLLAREQPARG